MEALPKADFGEVVPLHNSESSRPIDDFLSYIDKMVFFGNSSRRGSFESYMSYYRRRAAWHRRIFRSSGLLAIILSLSLPVLLLAFPEGKRWGQVITSVVAALVALSTTINNFLRSDSSW